MHSFGNLSIGVLRYQGITRLRNSLHTGGNIHPVTYHIIFPLGGGADVAGNDCAGVDADPHE